MPQKQRTIRMDDAAWQRAEALADISEVSISEFIRRLLNRAWNETAATGQQPQVR